MLPRYFLRFAAMRSWIITDIESPGLWLMISRIYAYRQLVPAIAERHKRAAKGHAVYSASHLYQAARPKNRRRLRPDHMGLATFSGRFLKGSCEQLRQVLRVMAAPAKSWLSASATAARLSLMSTKPATCNSLHSVPSILTSPVSLN